MPSTTIAGSASRIIANDKKADSWTFQAGIFNEPINNATFTRTGWQASVRGVYSPTLGSTRLHLGANFQHRENSREALGAEYRSRPLTQLTDQRFIDTGKIAARATSRGRRSRCDHKSFHFAGEAQKVWVERLQRRLKSRPSTPRRNQRHAARHGLQRQSELLGGYAEVGYLLHRRNPRLQGRQVRPHQGPASVQRRRLGRTSAQRPRRLCRASRSRRQQLDLGLGSVLRERRKANRLQGA